MRENRIYGLKGGSWKRAGAKALVPRHNLLMRRSVRSHASGANAEHTPMMSAAKARKRIAWQNKVYKEHFGRKRQRALVFLERKIVVYRNVFAPVPYEFNLLAKTVLREVKDTDSVLDMGTGSGIEAILAASKSKRVLAVDVNPDAVRCATRNVGMNGLTARIKVMQSDLYERVKGRFSLIMFDPPFRWTAPRDSWERSTADEGYATLQGFLRESRTRLTKNGRIILGFGTSGDIAYLKHLVRANGFRRKQLLKNRQKNGWTYFTFRLTC
jgi:release factor glutamine methyltransferase